MRKLRDERSRESIRTWATLNWVRPWASCGSCWTQRKNNRLSRRPIDFVDSISSIILATSFNRRESQRRQARRKSKMLLQNVSCWHSSKQTSSSRIMQKKEKVRKEWSNWVARGFLAISHSMQSREHFLNHFQATYVVRRSKKVSWSNAQIKMTFSRICSQFWVTWRKKLQSSHLPLHQCTKTTSTSSVPSRINDWT